MFLSKGTREDTLSLVSLNKNIMFLLSKKEGRTKYMKSILEKISRKRFCQELEGTFVNLVGFRSHETFKEDLKVLEENQEYKGKRNYVFYTRSNGFIRASSITGRSSCHTWEKGDKVYKFSNFFLIITKTRILMYKKAF